MSERCPIHRLAGCSCAAMRPFGAAVALTDGYAEIEAVLHDHREDALACYDHDGYCCICGEHDVLGYRPHLAVVLANRETLIVARAVAEATVRAQRGERP